MKGLHDLFIDELQLMYDAEQKIVNALPKIINAVSSKELKEALQKHLKETMEQVTRLEEIFKELGKNPTETQSEVIESLLQQAEKIIRANYETTVKDAALINCAQHVEHFEICSYGILKALAQLFNYDKILGLLEKTSKEEGHANHKLNELAEGTLLKEGINIKAKKHVA